MTTRLMNSTTSTTKKTCTVNGTDFVATPSRPTTHSTLTHTMKPLFGTIERKAAGTNACGSFLVTHARQSKKNLFILHCARLIVTLGFIRSYSRSTIKKKLIYFALCSLNRNFGLHPKLLTLDNQKKTYLFCIVLA